jgi:adenosine deaminase
MIQGNTGDYFEASELVVYAKALMRNHPFLRMMEGHFNGHLPKVKYIQGRVSQIRELHEEFNRGCFLEMRRLCSHTTDEAIENRLARLSRKLNKDGSTYSAGNSLQYDFIDLLPSLLRTLAEVFLCQGNDGSIRVRSGYLNLWQDLILVVPPLLISSAWMTSRLFVDGELSIAPDRQREVVRRLARWLCESTLPVDDSLFLDYICRTHGLDEVHMHLNGTTEAEKVWCDALKRPNEVVGRLLKANLSDSGARVSIGNGVDRLLRQEDSQLTRKMLRQRVEVAILRKGFLLNSSKSVNNSGERADTVEEEISASAGYYRKASNAVLANIGRHSRSHVVREAWQLCHIYALFFRYQATLEDGLAFWHYALLRAQFCRLLVQQKDQVGFDQFQYITQNELREDSEQDYVERFRQLERGHQRGIDHVEGRFSPKATPQKMSALLAKILCGYLQFLAENEFGDDYLQIPTPSSCSLSELVKYIRALEQGDVIEGDQVSRPTIAPQRSIRRLRFSLVAHFIKRRDIGERRQFFGNGLRSVCRDSKVRRETDQAARALVKVLQNTPGLLRLVRGIDAASNERHAAPEVFAPAFRRIRAAGITRLTYHVGEDFIHIASGLRAMIEAVRFLELDAGCRIGHGTASGLDVAVWWKVAGPHIVMPLEDRLDDLLFARDSILRSRKELSNLSLIDAEIQRLSQYIWQDSNVMPDDLVRAWMLRSLDPLSQKHVLNDVEPRRRAEARRFEQAKIADPVAHELFLRRHGVGATSAALKRCQEEIVISRDDHILGEPVLKALQYGVLSELNQRQIAIETLPSSNVRISIHDTYETHHSQNWLHPESPKERLHVSVAIGTDDPGIFATNLRMEYAHLLRPLQIMNDRVQGSERPELILEKICLDAKKFRF